MENTNLKPVIRFPEFTENWKETKFKNHFEFKNTNSLSRDKLNYESGCVKNIHYGDIHTKFNTHFDIKKEELPFINEDLDISRIDKENYVLEGDLVMADASEDYADIGKTIEITNTNNEKILAGLHTFLARKTDKTLVSGFFGYLLTNYNVRLELMRIAQGTKVLGLSKGRVEKITLAIPEPTEQKKIADFLTSIETRISSLKEKKDTLLDFKKGVMQKIFNQEIRFKDDNGNDFPDWEEKKLGEVLDYEQPTKYIVESIEYDNSFETPVLTAGKSFLLGYTDETENIFTDVPVIIFDDFTMANQFVTFPFKVKSSAMKILKNDVKKASIVFVYAAMEMIYYPKGDEHKRFWISEYSKIKIPFPSLSEQTKIANYLNALDTKIEGVQQKIEASIDFKKGLLQKMFV